VSLRLGRTGRADPDIGFINFSASDAAQAHRANAVAAKGFAPRSPQWLHELKLDGYRAIAFKRDGVVHLEINECPLANLPEARSGRGSGADESEDGGMPVAEA
jgi:hypothetical protein